MIQLFHLSSDQLPVKNELVDAIVIINASKEGPDTPLGGIQKAIIGQIAALRAAGFQVNLLSASERCSKIAQEMGCFVHYDARWHNGFKPFVIPELIRVLVRLKKKKPVAVLHHSGRTWAWSYLFFLSVPNIVVMHRELVRPYRFFRRWLALSPGFARQLKELDPLAWWRRVEWAPNSLMQDLPPEKTSGGENNPVLEQGAPLILGFLGRAGEGKGLEMLLQAMKILLESGHKVHLKLGGTVDPWVFAKISEYGIEDVVESLGWQENIDTFFSTINCLVLPSEKESFGLVIIEAMARKRPVIATACNGPSSIISHNNNGILVTIGDLDQFVSAIKILYSDPTLLKKLGLNGYKSVQNSYTPQVVAVSLVESLKRLGVRLSG